MVKAMNAKARAIAKFLGIAAVAGYFIGSAIPITSARAKRSAEDLRTFQQYTAEVNEVVTELRKEGLPVEDIFKEYEGVRAPGGERINLVTDLKKDPNSIYRSNFFKKMDAGKDYSKYASVTSYQPIDFFLKKNPKAISEKLMQRINALNRKYDKKIEPIFKKFDRMQEASRKRRKVAVGAFMGALAATTVALKDRDKRRRKKLVKRIRK